MELAKAYEIVLLLLLISCAVSVNLTKSLLHSVIIFMSYSSIMCLLWILMESPDLAITEAAVGAGISGILFLVTLKKLRQMDVSGGARETAPSMRGTGTSSAVTGEPGRTGNADRTGEPGRTGNADGTGGHEGGGTR